MHEIKKQDMKEKKSYNNGGKKGSRKGWKEVSG